MTTQSAPILDPQETIRPLESALRQLTELVEAETGETGSSDASSMESLLAEKRTTAKEYRGLFQHLAAHPNIAQGLASAERVRLSAAAERLAAATQANARALKAKLDANNALMRSIARAVEQKQVTASGYLDSGSMTGQPQDHTPLAALFSHVV